MNKMHSSLPILLLLALNCLARPAEDAGKDGAAVDPKTGMDGKMDQQQQQKGNGRMQSPPQFPDLPPQLEKVLPSDVVQKLKAVHVDPSLSFLDKQEKIDKIMTALPAEILDKIPAPPGFDRLPEDVRTKLKQIHRNKDKTWAQKQQEIQAYIQSLPTEQRAILMMPPPPPMGPPPPNFGGRR